LVARSGAVRPLPDLVGGEGVVGCTVCSGAGYACGLARERVQGGSGRAGARPSNSEGSKRRGLSGERVPRYRHTMGGAVVGPWCLVVGVNAAAGGAGGLMMCSRCERTVARECFGDKTGVHHLGWRGGESRLPAARNCGGGVGRSLARELVWLGGGSRSALQQRRRRRINARSGGRILMRRCDRVGLGGGGSRSALQERG